MLSQLDRLQPLGSMVARLILGAILATHGYQKVIPHGALYGFVNMVHSMGIPAWLGYVAAFAEFFGGILLIAGLLSRVCAFLLAVDMAVAVLRVHLHHGLVGPGGMEFPLALFAIAFAIMFWGPGWLALDDFVLGGGGSRSAGRSAARSR